MTHVACLNAFCLPEGADDVFTGNPAAVIPVMLRSLGKSNEKETVWMAGLSAQLNQNMTAYLRDLGSEEDDQGTRTHRFELRWFFISEELPLCGHGTFAAACAVWNEKSKVMCDSGVSQENKIVFETRSGELYASRSQQGVTIELPMLPVVGTVAADTDRYVQIITALNISKDKVEDISMNKDDLIVQVAGSRVVEGIVFCPKLLAGLNVRFVVVTSKANGGQSYDILSRVFPDEDPFCGAAHCGLAPYWRERLGTDGLIRARQVSKKPTLRYGQASVSTNTETGRVSLSGGSQLAW
eukprot:CAMPEP_0203756450 /NCGR_PEP_ID=MMETSP0098-20131031/9742_1 /ASSEMBLY_ACC=CAM_ASM_000208 /TAXON_ID=96639 /ORGANISM=" , Strain NY0313808BC1" /LENGTH=296 /DNA_ID=CAMNT_0050648345 /DNA_START=18 /DNA_END=905 /DNA_ORIENTATION=+